MNVKRYIVNDMAEAMIKIKNELGKDAIILSTRKIKKPGFLGIFKKPFLEVVVAIDDVKENNKKDKNSKIEEEELKKAILLAKEKVSKQEEEKKIELQSGEKKEIDRIDKEIKELKTLVKEFITKSNETIKPNQEKDDSKNLQNEITKKTIEDDIIDYLKDKDITHENSVKLLSRAKEISKKNDISLEEFKKVLFEIIDGVFEEIYTIEAEKETNKVFFFVGPTGVGKTTTLAKLAARLSLVDNKKIAFITADTYRIAAVDQLRTYSEILGIPLTVVYEADEIEDAIKKYSDMDYILVDTAGRNHKSKDLESEIKALLNKAGNTEVFLVISLTTTYKDIISIVDSYKFIENYKFIFTKLDEASSLANILNVKLIKENKLSYFTIGQSVPDDIEVASASRIKDFFSEVN